MSEEDNSCQEDQVTHHDTKCILLQKSYYFTLVSGTERYELYTEDRPITPIKLLEIDPSLDWSGDFPSNYSENEGKEFGDDVVFKSIQSMSELLTRS